MTIQSLERKRQTAWAARCDRLLAFVIRKAMSKLSTNSVRSDVVVAELRALPNSYVLRALSALKVPLMKKLADMKRDGIAEHEDKLLYEQRINDRFETTLLSTGASK